MVAIFHLLNFLIVTVVILLVVWEPLSPFRCVLALALPAAVVYHSLKKKSLNQSGAQAGVLSHVTFTV